MKEGRKMKRVSQMAVAFALLLAAGCGQSPPAQPPVVQKAPEPQTPADIQEAMAAVLGAESEVLVFGDLARTGKVQALGVNRLKTTPKDVSPTGVLFTRAAIVEKNGDKWKEVFRCDEHLKNPSGYLGGTPVAPVAGWRLMHEESAEKGLVMYFTPLAQPAGGYILTIGVRWNPKANRYQSLDRNYENFLGEVPSLEKIGFDLRR